MPLLCRRVIQSSGYALACYADILLARHALGDERLRDEPKECLRGRLGMPNSDAEPGSHARQTQRLDNAEYIFAYLVVKIALTIIK